MATYIITKRNYSEEKINIELPYYSKNICYAYKVIDSEKAICVCTASTGVGIAESYAGQAFNYDCIPCTEAEFEQIFRDVMVVLNGLNDLINS
jgi:hypothetical protein